MVKGEYIARSGYVLIINNHPITTNHPFELERTEKQVFAEKFGFTTREDIYLTTQGRNQNFSRGTHNFPNLSSPLSLYNNVIMLYTSTLLLFTRFYARFFTEIRVLKEKVRCFEKIYFRETNRVR